MSILAQEIKKRMRVIESLSDRKKQARIEDETDRILHNDLLPPNDQQIRVYNHSVAHQRWLCLSEIDATPIMNLPTRDLPKLDRSIQVRNVHVFDENAPNISRRRSVWVDEMIKYLDLAKYHHVTIFSNGLVFKAVNSFESPLRFQGHLSFIASHKPYAISLRRVQKWGGLARVAWQLYMRQPYYSPTANHTILIGEPNIRTHCLNEFAADVVPLFAIQQAETTPTGARSMVVGVQGCVPPARWARCLEVLETVGPKAPDSPIEISSGSEGLVYAAT